MTTIKIKKGAGTPSGLTFGELAYDVTNKKLFIGITGGNALLANTDGGVASIRGLTGTVGITNGNGIGLSVSGQTMTFSNTGVLSIDGSTGAITNVARKNVNNNFSSAQSISSGSYKSTISGNSISFYEGDLFGTTQSWQIPSGPSNVTISFPSESGTLALTKNIVSSFNGLTGAVTGVTVGGTNVFTALNTFNAGISAAGGITFSGTVSSDTGYRISSSALNTQTGTTYTFIAADNGEIVTFNNGSTTTVTVPTGLPVGFNCTAIQLGTGLVGFTAASGVTLNAYASGFKIAGQHGSAALISYASNVYNLSGTLTI